ASVFIDNCPFLHGAEANTLIHPIGIESPAIDHEPESPPKFRPLDVDTRLRKCEHAGSGDLIVANDLFRQGRKFGGEVHGERIAFYDEASDGPSRGGIALIVRNCAERVDSGLA